jgi:hypothetical protein
MIGNPDKTPCHLTSTSLQIKLQNKKVIDNRFGMLSMTSMSI